MKNIRYQFHLSTRTILAIAGFVAIFVLILLSTTADAATPGSAGGKLITIHDRGQEKVILTDKDTLSAALKQADVTIDKHDTVEPAIDSKLVASTYQVNIYRAKPVIVVDGNDRTRVMTAHTSGQDIASDAGIKLRDEDDTKMRLSMDFVSSGPAMEMTIQRATEFQLNLYGDTTTAYTQGQTVGQVLEEKGIKLGDKDRVKPGKSTKISKDMTIKIWREGKQTVTKKEVIKHDVRKIIDANRPAGYKKVKTEGHNGQRSVTYEIIMDKSGNLVSRQKIQSVVLKKPVKQVVVVGAKSSNPLTKGKGVVRHTDSNGITHRETYYDLPMNVVMGACGGGNYTVRADGAKVDKDGYILVAAHLGNYPRCSVVETSMGPGKVYDTGGFAKRHPHGFDLATDWTNYNKR